MVNELTVADWQHRLDREFPHGVVASWNDGNPRSATYLIPRIHVTGVRDGLPVVWLAAFSGSDKVLGPWPVTAMTTPSLHPRIVRVSFEDIDKEMTWSAGVDERLRAEMSRERLDSLGRHPHGGMKVMESESPDLP